MGSLLNHPIVRYRLPVIILLHAVFAAGALLLSFLLRFDFTLGFRDYPTLFYKSLPINVTLFLIFSGVFRLYQGIWRYVSVDDLLDITKAAALSSLCFMFVIVFSGQFIGYPRSIYILNFFFFIILNGGTRFAIRIFRESFAPQSDTARNVLIIGAGSVGNEIAKTLKSGKSHQYIPVGFIDADPSTHGHRLQGLKVFGGLSVLRHTIKKNRVHEIFIAIPEATNRAVQEIMAAAKTPDWELRFKIVPSLLDIMSGKLQTTQIRDVSIEDLLSRPNIKLDDTHVRTALKGKTVMITGAGGSIGSEICYQVAAYAPTKIVLFDLNEGNAYGIDHELRRSHPQIQIVTVVGSVMDLPLLHSVLQTHRPNHVYHAAAYKHVHLMEWNPFSCIRNNVLGTQALVNAAEAAGTEKFVMISTDKAVHPLGMMGISKRIAERVVLERPTQGKTQFNVVRFGNVLGSSGSVIPLFQKQIREGGPVTVTHPEMTRFFMSIPEAVQLVLQAATLDNTGCVYLLEMGEPVKIVDLAKQLIELSGLRVGGDIEIAFTGLRDGEKIHEELLTKSENVLPTTYDKIRVQKHAQTDHKLVTAKLTSLEKAVSQFDHDLLYTTIQDLVPEGKWVPASPLPTGWGIKK